MKKHIATAAFAAAVAITPATRAGADAGDVAAGLIIGGILGHAISNDQRNRRATQPRASSSGVSSATRAQNREVQTSLNYFGFNAGAVDGAIGRGTRAAIAAYQAHLGYPATGQLTPYERDFLVTSYQRAMAGGAHTAQMIATNPMGTKGLLTTFRDQSLGIQTPQLATAPTIVQPAVPQTTTVVAPAEVPATTTVVAPGTMAAAAGATTALPNFLGSATTPQESLASHCNQVSLLTSTNGGFVTLASMTDPMVALSEQFCLARTYAIAEGEQMAASIQGFTPQQIAEQCKGFGPALQEHVSSLSLKSRDEVLQGVSGFALGSGIAPAQLAGTAKICLSVGYRTDDMDVAIGSALLLTALGERAYGELLGHHLAQGFGATERTDLALTWYDLGLEAVAAGARQVVAPGQPERADLLRRAAYAVGGRADLGTAPVPASAAPSQPAALPIFKVQN